MMDHFSAQTEEPWLLFLLVLFGEDSHLVKSLHQGWKKNLKAMIAKHPEILNSASGWMLPYFSAWRSLNPGKPMKLVPLHQEKTLLKVSQQNASLHLFLFLSFLHHWLHYSIADIASITGLSIGTVELRLEKLSQECQILRFENFWKEKTHSAQESLRELTSVGLLSPYFKNPIKGAKVTTAKPWYLRPLFEGLFTAALLFGIITSGPRLKVLYEIWLEKRLNFTELAEWNKGSEPDPAVSAKDEFPVNSSSIESALAPSSPSGLEDGAKPSAGKSTRAGDIASAPADTGISESSVSSVFGDQDAKTASSMKAYRILIQSDSPTSIKNEIIQILTKFSVVSHAGTKDDPSLQGIEMPGGILFDGFVSLNQYKKFIDEVSHTGRTKVIVTQARERPFPDRARVKIWIQQY